jgi:glycerophosphoryl diester phosphodiesterase
LLAEKCRALGKRITAAVTVSSFNPFCLKAFKQTWQTIGSGGESAAEIPTAIIWSAGTEVPLLLRSGFGRILSGCDYLKPVYRQVNALTRFRFSVLERRPLIPWTVDDPSVAEKLIGAGCEGIITNRPQDFCGQN